MKKTKFLLSLLLAGFASAQHIENSETLNAFAEKLNQNKEVTQILFIGDSHTQAGVLPNELKDKFQNKYGNAGRGLIFPYQVANSNGPADFTSVSNQPWVTFRLVYEQKVYDQMGIAGFVMGNDKESFLEVSLENPDDKFTHLNIYSDPSVDGNTLTFYKDNSSLSQFVKDKKTRIHYTTKGENLPELAAKYNTVTTRINVLNKLKSMEIPTGTPLKIDKIDIDYNPDFENHIQRWGETKIDKGLAFYSFEKPQSSFLIKMNDKQNLLNGFQLLNSKKTGVVFNTIGVNGATYGDFLKYPLQMNQIRTLPIDLAIISLGTNESLSSITQEEFKTSIRELIAELRKDKKEMPILLIAPTTNKIASKKIPYFVKSLEESAKENNVAFLNMYKITGDNYFIRSLKTGKANKDGVHFLPEGYREQSQIIWKALSSILD